MILAQYVFNTPIGEMCALIDNEYLYFLQFCEPYEKFDYRIKKFISLNKITISDQIPKIALEIEDEIKRYFNNDLKEFKIKLNLIGADFQKLVWNQILKIPYGITKSYKDISISINKPNAFRAIGNANAMNKIAILIPCHRVVGHDGGISGYSWGVDRKNYLLDIEK